MDDEKTCKVQIAPVKNIEATRFVADFVHSLHIMLRSCCDINKDRNQGAYIILCMQLNGCFGSSERSPAKHTQTKINGGGVKRIDGIGKGKATLLITDTHLTGHGNEVL